MMALIRNWFYQWFGYSRPESLRSVRSTALRRAGVICYLLFISSLHLAKGLDLDSEDPEIWYFMGAAIVFLAAKLVLTDWRLKELCYCVPLALFAMLTSYIANSNTLLITIMAIIGAKGVDLKKIISVVFLIRLACFAFVVSVHLTPLKDMVSGFCYRYTPYASYNGHPSDGYWGVFGFLNKNSAGMNMTLLIMMSVYFWGKRYRIYHVAVYSVMNYVFYAMTGSRTSFLGTMFFLVLAWLVLRPRIGKPIAALCALLPLFGFLFLFITQALYPTNAFVSEVLDKWLTKRVQYVHYYFRWLEIQLFGRNMQPYYNGQFFLDSAILVILFSYGMAMFALSMVATTFSIFRSAQSQNREESAYTSAMVTIGVAEQYPFNVSLNIFLLFYADFLFERSDDWNPAPPMAQRLDRHVVLSVPGTETLASESSWFTWRNEPQERECGKGGCA